MNTNFSSTTTKTVTKSLTLRLPPIYILDILFVGDVLFKSSTPMPHDNPKHAQHFQSTEELDLPRLSCCTDYFASIRDH